MGIRLHGQQEHPATVGLTTPRKVGRHVNPHLGIDCLRQARPIRHSSSELCTNRGASLAFQSPAADAITNVDLSQSELTVSYRKPVLNDVKEDLSAIGLLAEQCQDVLKEHHTTRSSNEDAHVVFQPLH